MQSIIPLSSSPKFYLPGGKHAAMQYFRLAPPAGIGPEEVRQGCLLTPAPRLLHSPDMPAVGQSVGYGARLLMGYMTGDF